MERIYLICAVVGGTLIVCQFALTLLGLGGGHDMDTGGGDVHLDVGGHDVGHGMGDHDVGGHDASGHDHGTQGHHSTNWLFGILTFRTIVAGLAFFGLTGLALRNNTDLNDTVKALAAVAAGCVAILIVAWIMRSLTKLNIDGTVRIQRAVGSTGTVYLSIPGNKEGAGKVHVSVQGRLMEYKAITPLGNLPTGTKVVVVNVVGSDTLEVHPVESLQSTQTLDLPVTQS